MSINIAFSIPGFKGYFVMSQTRVFIKLPFRFCFYPEPLAANIFRISFCRMFSQQLAKASVE